ncbi:MAG: YeeE/YedE family protein [Sedimentisphaerales bacterium]|nr:YeeE/YedE family protein [Sedimentisphaerales bacterium]
MSENMISFIIGALFGVALLLGGLADPDKIIGTLRLKDFHAMRTIAVFVLIGMLGTWILEMEGVAHFSVKPAAIVAVLLGGALLGVGFGLTGYCPGTGLACAAAGRLDALITVIGMFVGALVFILIYPSIVQPIDAIANHGKKMLPEITGISRTVWVLALSGVGFFVLLVTGLKKKSLPQSE